MGPKKKRGLMKELTIDEDVRIAVNLKLKDFRNNEEEKGNFFLPFLLFIFELNAVFTCGDS